MPHTLLQFNQAPPATASEILQGLYEHSPWVVEGVLAKRPFVSIAALKYALVEVVEGASLEQKLSLLRAHPPLNPAVATKLTDDSKHEQKQAGLQSCTPTELEQLRRLNAEYMERFTWHFIVAVKGPRSLGLSPADIIAHLQRRLHAHPEEEQRECIREIHRIAEIRLQERLGAVPVEGHAVWDWHQALAKYTDPEYAAHKQLTVTYLTDAHRACAKQLAQQMQSLGFDSVHVDILGNVVGRYEAEPRTKAKVSSKTLLTGSHYDTVRNGGRYDGRLGIFVPMAVVESLVREKRRLPFALEVVGFAEEEGQRYSATFLGSSALTGNFNPEWLTQTDSAGKGLKEVILEAGWSDLPATASSEEVLKKVKSLKRDPKQYLGFVEVHIEQGPVLNRLGIPLGVVSSINGSSRYLVHITGTASHAGTTPMKHRGDAATAAAEIILLVERVAGEQANAVGTVGILQVPNGSINVIPGECHLSLDLRAPTDTERDWLEHKIMAGIRVIMEQRAIQCALTKTLTAAAAPSAPAWQKRWEKAVESLGVPVHIMPSGAGHDAMQLHRIMPQAMLFVRGENKGISHNPLESTTSDDMQLAISAFKSLVDDLAVE